MDQLDGLTEEVRTLALERFRSLQPHLEDGRPLKLVGAEADIPFRTAQRWVAPYRKFGLAALARKNRADRGERRAASVKIKETIEGLALQTLLGPDMEMTPPDSRSIEEVVTTRMQILGGQIRATRRVVI